MRGCGKKREREDEHRDQELNTEANQLQEVLELGRKGKVNRETENKTSKGGQKPNYHADLETKLIKYTKKG